MDGFSPERTQAFLRSALLPAGKERDHWLSVTVHFGKNLLRDSVWTFGLFCSPAVCGNYGFCLAGRFKGPIAKLVI